MCDLINIMDNKHFTNIVFPIIASKDNDSEIIADLSILDFYDKISQLNIIKSNIDQIGEKEWDYFKKKSNPFECVTTNGGLANYTPISRAYFKMLEIMHVFKPEIQKFTEPFTTLHLAEGPGGFMECIYNMFVDMNCTNFKMYGMTLMKEDKSVPSWKKSNFFFQHNTNVESLTGVDGTGDLYNIDNIYDIIEKIPQKAEIITGDGGFDFSNDFNQQESMSFPLLYCQSLSALLTQKKGGMFILKFFDTYQTKTLQLIYLLNKCYEKLDFIKPYTSRPGNSEKYLVCSGFLDNISREEIHKLLLDIPRIGSTINNHLQISKYNTTDMKFYKCIHDINNVTFERQKEFIENTLKLNKENGLDEAKEELFKNQIMTSSAWCKLYGVKINYQSKFINSYYRITNND